MNNLEIGPILRAMMRNKVGAVLIAIQIAFTMTIVVNAISIIQERLWFEGKTVVDYDGVFALPNGVIELLKENGYNTEEVQG